ncbi:MAG: VOC family protein [Pseudomonadota bacterium]
MQVVTGIGGFFFKAENPEELRKWYKDHLGIDLAPQYTGGMPWVQESGFTIFDPFARDNPMIPEGKNWMINFRVENINAMVEQLKQAGTVVSEIDEFPHGKFATLNDPEGNGIQLWQPPIS